MDRGRRLRGCRAATARVPAGEPTDGELEFPPSLRPTEDGRSLGSKTDSSDFVEPSVISLRPLSWPRSPVKRRTSL